MTAVLSRERRVVNAKVMRAVRTFSHLDSQIVGHRKRFGECHALPLRGLNNEVSRDGLQATADIL